MTGTRHTGAPHSRQDTLIGMRNCLEYLAHEAKGQDLGLTHWLLRMAIASLDEEMTANGARSLDVVDPVEAARVRPAQPETSRAAQKSGSSTTLEHSQSAVD
ncbi:MAG: hypothetical protein ACFB6R_05685 [Alphaproteobacteria bacterium]